MDDDIELADCDEGEDLEGDDIALVEIQDRLTPNSEEATHHFFVPSGETCESGSESEDHGEQET